MKLQGRNLVFGIQGNDVRELQRDLVRLDFDILSEEIKGERFGDRSGGLSNHVNHRHHILLLPSPTNLRNAQMLEIGIHKPHSELHLDIDALL